TAPTAPLTHALSLHDALPISEPEASAVLGGHPRQNRIRSPDLVHDLQAQPPLAVRRSLRCARYAALLRAPRTIDARSAGAGTAERTNLQRSGRGFRRPHHEGAVHRGGTNRLCLAFGCGPFTT